MQAACVSGPLPTTIPPHSLLVRQLDRGAAVLGQQHLVALLDAHGHQLACSSRERSAAQGWVRWQRGRQSSTDKPKHFGTYWASSSLSGVEPSLEQRPLSVWLSPVLVLRPGPTAMTVAEVSCGGGQGSSGQAGSARRNAVCGCARAGGLRARQEGATAPSGPQTLAAARRPQTLLGPRSSPPAHGLAGTAGDTRLLRLGKRGDHGCN